MKNKRLLIMLGITTLAVSMFVGCSSKEPEVEEKIAIESGKKVSEDIGKLADGTYRIEYDETNEEGWKTFLEVTVEDGNMVEVNFDEINASEKNHKEDDEDDEADEVLELALMNARSIDEFQQMIEGSEEAETFTTFAKQLMKQMTEGNTDTIIVKRAQT